MYHYLYCIVLYYIILYYIILYYVILYYIILYPIMLSHPVLYVAVLYCAGHGYAVQVHSNIDGSLSVAWQCFECIIQVICLLLCRMASQEKACLDAEGSTASVHSHRSGSSRPPALMQTAVRYRAGGGAGGVCSTPPSANKKGGWSLSSTGRGSPGPMPKPRVCLGSSIILFLHPNPTNVCDTKYQFFQSRS